jgi:hypothetical protein
MTNSSLVVSIAMLATSAAFSRSWSEGQKDAFNNTKRGRTMVRRRSWSLGKSPSPSCQRTASSSGYMYVIRPASLPASLPVTPTNEDLSEIPANCPGLLDLVASPHDGNPGRTESSDRHCDRPLPDTQTRRGSRQVQHLSKKLTGPSSLQKGLSSAPCLADSPPSRGPQDSLRSSTTTAPGNEPAASATHLSTRQLFSSGKSIVDLYFEEEFRRLAVCLHDKDAVASSSMRHWQSFERCPTTDSVKSTASTVRNAHWRNSGSFSSWKSRTRLLDRCTEKDFGEGRSSFKPVEKYSDNDRPACSTETVLDEMTAESNIPMPSPSFPRRIVSKGFHEDRTGLA